MNFGGRVGGNVNVGCVLDMFVAMQKTHIKKKSMLDEEIKCQLFDLRRLI